MVVRSYWRMAVCLGLATCTVTAGCQTGKVALDRRADEPLRMVKATEPPSPPLERHDLESSDDESTIRLAAAEVAVPPAPDSADSEADATAEPIVNDTQPIDLTTALLLTGGESPQIAFAQARIEESLAQIDRADVLWLPSLRAGVNYNKHEGRIQDVAGNIIETSRGSLYTGLGANAVGAASPAIPGVIAQFHFTDAVFQPRIARQTNCARQWAAQAVTNDALLQTALAYVGLMRAAQELAVTREIESHAKELERVTGEFARTGQGLPADHDRLRTELALRTIDVRRAEEAVAVASARLAEQVRWDASRRLVPLETQLAPIELVSPETPPQGLVAMALAQRPEITESRYLLGEAIERLQRERYAPLIPSVLLGLSYGGLGGGLGSNVTNFGDRLDADAVAFWEVRQFGLGEQASRREANSRIHQARAREIQMLDRVAREVVEARAQVVSRSQQITTAREAVAAAQDSFQRNTARIQNGQGLPIEVLQSIQALASAQREYVRVVADYNTAQFTLHRALGWPIQSAN